MVAKRAGTKRTRVPQRYLDFNWDDSPMPVYANVATAARDVDIFGLVFAEIRPESAAVKDSNGDESTAAYIVASLRIPPSAMVHVTDAIVRVWNDYVSALPEKERGKLKRYVAMSTPPSGG